MSIKIEGIEKLEEHLEQITDAEGMRRAVGLACELVVDAAKEKAPKDTGALRRSIQSKVDAGGNSIVGTVFTPLEYAPYVEFGTGKEAEKGGRSDVPWRYQDEDGNWHTTSGQKPHPFMRPAINENRQKIKSILKEGMK